MTDIPVKGAVIEWARIFRGLSPEDAADRLGLTLEHLQEIETGARLPTLTQFEKIGTVYQLPLATLFRRTPPKEPDDLPDFRTFEGAPPRNSFDFLVALSNVRSLQATLRVLKMEDDLFQSAQMRQYSLAGDPFTQGEAERRALGVSIQRQLDWRPENGFRHWRAIIERLGISVYLQNFEDTDCIGCAIWEDGELPAILINKSVRAVNSWIFTLIHEYAHLLIRRPGISDQNSRNPVEAFCNRFSAAFLMPAGALRRLLPNWPQGPEDWPDQTIRNAARQLKVSAQALAIRLEELGVAHSGFNRRFIAHAGSRKPEGGGYVRTRLSEIGGRYTTSVISALDRDVIDNVHASQALGFGITHLEAARSYVERQREYARDE
jgi:Zn-dependent peptidase ImmA (M78 family)/DNA-binding XRE family transcriptional regulator